MIESRPPQRRRQAGFFVRLAIGLGILAVLCVLVDVRELLARLLAVNPIYGIAMCSVAIGSRMLRAFKWNLLLRVQRVQLAWWYALRVCFVGHFCAAWMPGAIGGDAYRLAALRKLNRTPAVLSSIVVERYVGLLVQTLFVVALLPWTVPYLLKLSPLIMAAIVGFTLLVTALLPAMASGSFVRTVGRVALVWKAGWLNKKVEVFHEALLEYAHHKLSLLAFVCLTVVEVISFFVINYLAARAVGLDVSFLYFMCAMPVVHLILHIPISVQALGVQEGALATALVLHGFTVADGLSISIVQRAVEWMCSILPGAAFLLLFPGETGVGGLVRRDDPALTTSSATAADA